ncbi:Arf GTPase activating protein, partial [Anaeromyces robustus]
ELKYQDGNNNCIDCGASNPQWASVNYGVFLCSKCFDEHRSIIEDNDILLSLTIDNWTEDQIKRIKFGGNNNAKKYFEKQPKYDQNMSITEKYNSSFAKNYIEEL